MEPRSGRRFSAPSGRRDVDQLNRARRLQVFAWSLTGGLIGGLWGVFGVLLSDWGVWTIPAMALLGWSVSSFGTFGVLAFAGRAGQLLYSPSGKSTPSKQEYSFAESLVARGRFQEAVDAFTDIVASGTSDPTPYLRIARVYRDELRQHDDAARWFKKAIMDSSMHSGLLALTARELVELCAAKLEDPARAAPTLAWIAERHAGTEQGEWAASELLRVKPTPKEGQDG